MHLNGHACEWYRHWCLDPADQQRRPARITSPLTWRRSAPASTIPGRPPLWLPTHSCIKVREAAGHPVDTFAAAGINTAGHREILGVRVNTSEDGAGWLTFLRGLAARGLAGASSW